MPKKIRNNDGVRIMLTTMFQKRKKVAVNLSGSMKFWRRSLETIGKLASECDLTVFIHCWENSELLNKHSWQFSPYAFNENGPAQAIIEQYPNVVSSVVEDFSTKIPVFEEVFNRIPFHIRNVTTIGPISMFYSMHHCSDLIKKFEMENGVFDAILRLRFDCLLGDFNILEHNGYVVLPAFCEDIWETTPAAVSDWVACGPSDAMHEYFNVYDNIVDLCKAGSILYGEGLLGSHLLRMNTPVMRKFVWCAIADKLLPCKEDASKAVEIFGKHLGPVRREDQRVLWFDWYGRYQYGNDHVHGTTE